ncbi:MAG TPA: hypothetical protein VF074_01575 [Pyrinomonadaceae bacterium]
MNKPNKTRFPFPFVLDELMPLRPIVKRAFGFTYIYLDEVLLCGLRDSVQKPATNGIWLFTTSEHVESLLQEFPGLPRRCLWRSGKNAWIILASRLEYFEEYAFKTCELILNGDRRIGRLSRSK